MTKEKIIRNIVWTEMTKLRIGQRIEFKQLRKRFILRRVK